MINRQTLAVAGPFPIPVKPRRDRAASLGAGPRYWLGDPRPATAQV